MPRLRTDEPREVQVTFRLTRRQHQTLVAAAFVDPRAGGANDLAHRVVVDRLAQLGEDPHVRAAIEAAEGYADSLGADVVPITGAKKAQRSK